MKQDYPHLSKEVLCRLFGKTRHAYYDHQWRHQDTSLKDEIILQLVHAIRETLPRLGTRKLQVMLTAELISHKIEVGRDYLFDLLEEHKLLIRQRKRKVYTTDSRHWMPIWPRNSEVGSPIHTTRQNALLFPRSMAMISPVPCTQRRPVTRAPRAEMSYVQAISSAGLWAPSQLVTRIGRATWMRLLWRSAN